MSRRVEKTTKRQLTMAESIEKTRPYEFDDSRSRRINKAVGEMIAVDNEPFAIVEHDGFTRLLKLLEPCYQLPSSKYFSETLIPEMYEKVKNKVKHSLSNIDYVSITTDIWSSVAQDSYISLTCHSITDDFQYQHICLHAAPFNERHTGEHIATMLTGCLESWSLSDKLHVVVRDNGSNFIAGLQDNGIPNIPCLAHTLQLIVKDGCLAQPAVMVLTTRARKLVTHYKHSNVALQALFKTQEQLGMSKCRLIQDEPTRWNSTFYMLQRLLEQKKAVIATSVELNIHVELTSAQWILAEKIVEILQVYEEATRGASGNYSTAAVVIPIVNSIQKFLETSDSDFGVMKMKTEMLASLKRCYQDMESNSFFVVATLLDPRFKDRVFSSKSSGMTAKEMLISMYEAQAHTDIAESPLDSTQPMEDGSVSASCSLLWSYCSEIIAEKSEDSTVAECSESVVEQYLKEPNIPHDPKSDPLSYWKGRASQWPILAQLAQKYLSAPPASVASERLFSSAADICTNTRNSLSPNKVEQLLFLNQNL